MNIYKDGIMASTNTKDKMLASLRDYVFTEYARTYDDMTSTIRKAQRPIGVYIEDISPNSYRGSIYDNIDVYATVGSWPFYQTLRVYLYLPYGNKEWFCGDSLLKYIEKVYSPEAVFRYYSGKMEQQFEGVQNKIKEAIRIENQKADEIIRGKTQEVNDIIRKVSEKIDDMPDTFPNMITSGVYQPINILPGRTESIVVPFSKHKDDEEIKKIFVHVFDLPTKVNEAGVPIKRANFHFEMVAEEAR